jgi:diacylglycerol kinase family enzyme
MYPCTYAKISAPRPVPVQIDGDLFGATPLETQAGSDIIQLIVPAKALSGRL